jgi:type VI secretion system secreted protein Hcp
MAVNAFLTFFDSADGESLRKGHEKWIEVQSWDWEIEAESSESPGGGSVATPRPGVLRWSHRYDTASSFLLRSLITEITVPKAQLQVYRPGAKGLDVLYLTVTMEDVRILGLANTAVDDGTTQQQVTMEFATVTLEYRHQSPSGTAGAVQTLTWDVPAGTVSPSA